MLGGGATSAPNGSVGSLDGVSRVLPFGGSGLVGGDREEKARVAKNAKAFERAREETDLIGVKGD